MRKLLILIALLITATAFSQEKAFLKNEKAKDQSVQLHVRPPNTLVREYHFEINLGQDKVVIFTDVVGPFPPQFEKYNIEFKGSKAIMEVSVHQNTGGSGVGTGKIMLNGDVTFGTLDFETTEKSTGTNYLILGMVSRPQVIGPTGQNALTLDFTKGTLGGLLVQVKIKMYK